MADGCACAPASSTARATSGSREGHDLTHLALDGLLGHEAAGARPGLAGIIHRGGDPVPMAPLKSSSTWRSATRRPISSARSTGVAARPAPQQHVDHVRCHLCGGAPDHGDGVLGEQDLVHGGVGLPLFRRRKSWNGPCRGAWRPTAGGIYARAWPSSPTTQTRGRHAPGDERYWNESWYLDFVSDDGRLGGYGAGLYPNLGVCWYWACVVG